MKIGRSVIFGLVGTSFVVVGFWLEWIVRGGGNSLLAVAVKVLLFPAACVAFALSDGRRKEGVSFRKRLLSVCGKGKVGAADIAVPVCAGVLFWFFAAFFSDGIVSVFEAATERISLFPGPVLPDGGEYAAALVLKGVLLPAGAAFFYFGIGRGFYGETKGGTAMLVLYATFVEFSAESVIVFAAVNALCARLTKKSDSAIPAAIASVVFSLCNLTVPFFATLPFSCRLVTTVETAAYYGPVSVGIGLLFLAAVVLLLGFYGKEEKSEKKAGSEDKFVFFGACVLYFVLAVALNAGIA